MNQMNCDTQRKIDMNPDNASKSARPGPDELVPSRYALRIGEIDVLVVSDGVLLLPGAMLAHNADAAVRTAWFEENFLPTDAFDWALNAIVVRSGDRTILVDAGMGMEFPNLPRSGQLVQRLEAVGIELSSVTDVVLTHMHMDHIGGLMIDCVKEALRPDLRIHVATAEVEFWKSPDFSRVSMPEGFPDALRQSAKRFLKEYRSKFRTFEDECEVAPGVKVCRTGGHTPGHSVVRLASGGDRLTFAGDLVSGRIRTSRVAQRLRARPRGSDPRPGASFAGPSGEPRAAGGHSYAVPVRRPCGGRRRGFSLGTGLLGLLITCSVQDRTGARTHGVSESTPWFNQFELRNT
jgi:glyoxylase-like metal-dependent hydrolase (beta-lactamase superfamily II)